MAKLCFHPYGEEVHKALFPRGLAPAFLGSSCKPAIGASVIVMEFLPLPTVDQPGWHTLHYFDTIHPELVHEKKDAIWEQLAAILSTLKELHLVHGDLRSNNLMIHVTQDAIVVPIQLKAIDMEWGGKVGVACYPADRNDVVGFPGKAAHVIGSTDDEVMVKSWWGTLRRN
jgi:hypothetical protein